jgi:hypothetical protein
MPLPLLKTPYPVFFSRFILFYTLKMLAQWWADEKENPVGNLRPLGMIDLIADTLSTA